MSAIAIRPVTITEGASGQIPFGQAIEARCRSCSATVRIDLAGLTPKTDIICPACGEVSRFSSLTINRRRARFEKLVGRMGAPNQGESQAANEIREAHRAITSTKPLRVARVSSKSADAHRDIPAKFEEG